MASRMHLPKDMPAELAAKLHCDAATYGHAFYRVLEDGKYERVAPLALRCADCGGYHVGGE